MKNSLKFIPDISYPLKFKQAFLDKLAIDIYSLPQKQQKEISNIIIDCYEAILSGFCKKITPCFYNNVQNKFYVKTITKHAYYISGIKYADIPKKTNKHFLKKYKLGFIYRYYDRSKISLVTLAFPENTFKPWEFKREVSWASLKNNTLPKQATKWLIEKKLKIKNIKDIPKNISIKAFQDNNLLGMIIVFYKYSMSKAILDAYPNQLKPWDLKILWQSYDRKHNLGAIRWLVENKLGGSDFNNLIKIQKKSFARHGFRQLLEVFYKGDLVGILNDAYPGYKEFYKENYKEIKEPFLSYKEASFLVKTLNIQSAKEYKAIYKNYKKLPFAPDASYKNKGWINWFEFLGKKLMV
jgi:hypothetical protein